MDEKKPEADAPSQEDLAEDGEQIDDCFVCSVCLDLIYKPVVLACGHISCFWCVHRAMSGFGESHCPLCRFPYYHFPSICQLLHFLLLKIYPITNKRREKQVLEEEQKYDCFSPQFIDNLYKPHTCEDLNGEQDLKVPFEENATTISGETNAGLEEPSISAVEESNVPENDLKDGSCQLVSINDVLCHACMQLLFRPIVLNCGHVYCESCISIPVDEALRCQLCQSPHPKGCPKICLALDQFLKKRFPAEYMLRSETVQCQPVQCQQGSPSMCANEDGKQGVRSSSSPTQNFFSWLGDRGLNVHIGAGCDYCGMYPIVGQRYQCKDCVEKIGFDLCGECYNTRSKLPGRFNQQHKPEHNFELVQANLIHDLMMRMVSEHSEDGASVPILSDDASEDLEEGYVAPTFFDDAPEDPEGGTHFC